MMTTQETIKSVLKELSSRQEQYRKAHDYYRGKHNLCFATERFRNAFGHLFRKFAMNLMPTVVDAVKNKLRVTGFVVEEGSDLATEAWKIWQTNRMQQQAGSVHLEALKAGDAYVIVWPDRNGIARIYPQKARLCTVTYDEEEPGRVVSAAKVWLTAGNKVRLNLYYPDRIEKYITRGSHSNGLPDGAKAFDPFLVDGETWTLENPYGVLPVFHFANNAAIGEFGDGELRNVMPIQDGLNKTVLDLMVAGEFFSFPQRYAIGLEVDSDPVSGKPVLPWTGVERWLTVGSENAKFGQFESGDLDQFLKVKAEFAADVARISGTPLHYLMLDKGDFPSGEAMNRAEARLLSKVEDRQISFGGEWESVLALALQIDGHGDERTRLFVQWADAATVSDSEKLDTLLKKKDLGVSDRQLLIEAGYGEKDIELMLAESAALRREAFNEFNAG
jgi:hypothetical protein